MRRQVQGTAVEGRGSHRVPGREFRLLSLPNPFSERTSSREGPGLSGSIVLFPREDELSAGNRGHQGHDGIVIGPKPWKLWIGGKGGGLPESCSFQPGSEVLLQLSDHAPLLVLPAGSCELPFLHHQAEAQRHQGNARQQYCREEQKNLPLVRMWSHGPSPPLG
jgi:hypothetical protein